MDKDYNVKEWLGKVRKWEPPDEQMDLRSYIYRNKNLSPLNPQS